MPKPIFILSLPRSGSTLLQRVLVNTGYFGSKGETTLLLRFLGGERTLVRLANYREHNINLAQDDLRDAIPDFDQRYRDHVRHLMEDIYGQIAAGRKYVIDKTPRYTLIAKEIKEAFPDAYFIVLWRNPLAVAASVINSMSRGKWWFDDFMLDLASGARELRRFELENSGDSRIFSLRYEDFTKDPLRYVQEIGKFLGDEEVESVGELDFKSHDDSRLGDPQRSQRKGEADPSRGTDWESCFNNWYRIAWAKHIYEQNEEICQALGYEPIKGGEGFSMKNALKGFRDFKNYHKQKRRMLKRIEKIYQRNQCALG